MGIFFFLLEVLDVICCVSSEMVDTNHLIVADSVDIFVDRPLKEACATLIDFLQVKTT